MKDKNRVKERILKAAEEEFMQLGFAGAKTTSIAKKAGITHAMLHYYFNTKENLFNTVLDDKYKLMFESVFQNFTISDKPFLERLFDGIESHFDFIAQNPNLPRFVVNEIISVPERRAMLQENMNGFIDYALTNMQNELDNAASKGLIHPTKVRDLLVTIASLNVFPFITLPFIENYAIPKDTSLEEFFEARKKENIKILKTILLINKDEK